MSPCSRLTSYEKLHRENVIMKDAIARLSTCLEFTPKIERADVVVKRAAKIVSEVQGKLEGGRR